MKSSDLKGALTEIICIVCICASAYSTQYFSDFQAVTSLSTVAAERTLWNLEHVPS